MSRMATQIEKVSALEILDSRGTPTIRARVMLFGGAVGAANAPSGASTGAFEAYEKRDGGARYGGRGVSQAIEGIERRIDPALRGADACDQARVDATLRALDGTESLGVLGANAVIAVSTACARAAAQALNLPLFRHLGGIYGAVMPVPMMNLLNGGVHAKNNLDIQEFMIRPIGAECFSDALHMGVSIYRALSEALAARGLSCGVGDEGGFAPDLERDEDALALLVEATERAGFRPGVDVTLALDVAASGFFSDGRYLFKKRGEEKRFSQMLDYYEGLCAQYPIDSLEDPLDESDFFGFAALRKRLPHVQIVGDDLFTTNVARLARGIEQHSASAILIKPNQIGTVSQTMDCVRMAQKHDMRAIISHRSGETEDDFIADLAVATNAGQIKAGAPARTDRNCKYNRLLEIERALLG